ncbi:MAG TPA: helix-turn-helix domain-containing protein [Actinomadura sp.]|jgi:AcrR family transcriptional regulator|nr:helix-turn-helix domain-containing protein [Actinomadura sp.]
MALRADAARNRARILEAARAQIARHGPGVGMDQIAEAAGVAVGTLYRHFPTKADLIAAALADRTRRVVESVETAVERMDAGHRAVEEIAAVFAQLVDVSGQDRAVKSAAAALGINGDDQTRDRKRARAGLDLLIAAAHMAGDLHPDVTTDDIALLLTTMPGDEIDVRARNRWLELMLRGLTP